jgi:hypothetical protein
VLMPLDLPRPEVVLSDSHRLTLGEPASISVTPFSESSGTPTAKSITLSRVASATGSSSKGKNREISWEESVLKEDLSE